MAFFQRDSWAWMALQTPDALWGALVSLPHLFTGECVTSCLGLIR